MKKTVLFFLAMILGILGFAQNLQRPKLVVGIVIDQMRWDYLYRYYDRYAANGAFKRLLNQGFSCENTLIPYAPTVTACGHSCIYTGSVPAINGITGNIWWDYQKNIQMYCTDDRSVKTVGSASSLGEMSPKNLLVTTVCDELRLATNFHSKVIGIALKDRGGILPAGHSANAAYWYDNTNGNWITSSYYMKELPNWVKSFNDQKWVDKYYQQEWNTLFPVNTYTQSTEDAKSYEAKVFGANTFPYDLKRFTGKNYGIIESTPYGNSLTAEFAKAAIINEKLGSGDATDFLAVSFSSPDYIGHAFGPNSIEEEDNYLRLDKELADLMDFLDTKIGKDQYLLFLSADHGVAHVPGFLKEHNIPAGSSDLSGMSDWLNTILKDKYGKDNLVIGIYSLQVCLNHAAIDSAHLDLNDIKKTAINFLSSQPMVSRVFDITNISGTTLNEKIKSMLTNGYYPLRSGDVQIILLPQWLENFSAGGTTHGVWNPYDSHIPLLWYGWGVRQGKLNRETNMTDIAPTIAAMLHIQMPSGCVGKVIPEVMK